MDRSRLKHLVRHAAPACLLVLTVLQCLGGASALQAQCPASGLTLVPATLPGATAGATYHQDLSTTNGSGKTTFALSSGNLPAGLGLAPDGNISGVATSSGNFSFSVTATDKKGCTGTQSYAIPVACPPISISPASLPNGTVGTTYNQTLTASGGTAPYEFSLASGNLPPGLTLSPAGSLSGTPTSFGNFSFTISASDANACLGARAYAVTISSPCPTIDLSPGSLPSATTATPYSQTITASGGVGPYSFSVTSGSLPPGLTLSSSGALTGSPTATGSFNFIVTATDTNGCPGTKSYSIAVACSALAIAPATLPSAVTGATYRQVLTASGGVGPYTFGRSSGSLPSGLTLSTTGTISGTPNSLGTFDFVVLATDANNCSGSQSYSITVSCGPIALSPATLPGATSGAPYSQTITATGGTPSYTFALASGSLPTGLTLAPTGSLTGTPTAPGTFNFVVQATDANACVGTANYSITVACPTIALAPASLPAATVGTGYNQTITASGGTGPYTFTVTSGSVPAGLALSSGGALTGTPTAPGNFNFTVTATGAGGCTGSRSYSIAVACPAITVSPSALPSATVNVAYSKSITASGGVGPYSFAVTSGSLPTGLTLSPAGVLSGTPTTTGNFTFSITATDANGCTGSLGYSVSVGVAPCPTITLSPSTLPPGTAGTPYSQAITASGGAFPYTFSVRSGTLPAGLTLSASGVLSGTPTGAGVSTFFVTATDQNNCSGTAQYTLTISAGNTPTLTALNPSSAPAGGVGFTLQVAGSGFVPGSTIRWNGSPRPTTFVSATALSGTISAGDIAAAGSVPVTVVNPGGAASNALLFTISSVCEPPAAPQGPAIVPNDNPTGPVTGVDFLRLTWSPPGSGPAPSGYEWSLNGDPFVSAGTATSVVTGPRGNNDPIQLHVRAVGCSPGPAADSPVYSPAPPSAGFSTPGPAAVGAPVTFTDTSDPQATSWLWLFGDGQIATTQSTTHAFGAAGTYSVVLIASNGAGSSMALRTQVVQAGTPSVEQPTASRSFVASEPGRQWIRELRLIGPRRTWLHIAAPGAEDETVVYLRFYDAAARLLLERRLSVASGQEAVYDLGAFRLRGAYSVEAVSARRLELEVVETGRPEPAKRRDP